MGALPKRRISRRRQGKRRHHHQIKLPHLVKCPHCGKKKVITFMCPNCKK